MRRSNKILAAAPVTKSHDTSAKVAKEAVRLPITTLPKNGVSVLEKRTPNHRKRRPSDTNCWTCKGKGKIKLFERCLCFVDSFGSKFVCFRLLFRRNSFYFCRLGNRPSIHWHKFCGGPKEDNFLRDLRIRLLHRSVEINPYLLLSVVYRSEILLIP